MSVQQKLNKISGSSDSKQQAKKYKKLCDDLVKEKDIAGLKLFTTHVVDVVGESGAVVVSRPALKHFADVISTLDNEELMDISKHTLAIIKPKSMYYGAEVMTISHHLMECYQAEGDFRTAAKTLAAVDLDNLRNLSPAKKCNWLIFTALLYLEVGDSVAASTYIKRSHRDIFKVPADTIENKMIIARHRTGYAQILDAERRFLDASMRYIELSQSELFGDIKEGDLMDSLEKATTCAILAKAGPSRARVLAMIYRDERASQLRNFKFLEKMYKERVIREGEVENFNKMLQPHQQAELGNGVTVLQKAVNEHNMLAASNLYNNIKFAELGNLLGVSAEQAEEIASRMIEEERMKGSIDQIEQIVEFQNSEDDILLTWDNHIGGLCREVNDVLEKIAAVDSKYGL